MRIPFHITMKGNFADRYISKNTDKVFKGKEFKFSSF